MLFSSREGVTIDSLLSPFTRYILRPLVVLPIALCLSVDTLLIRFAPHITHQHLSNANTNAFSAAHPRLYFCAWVVAAMTSARAISDYLDLQMTNNWVGDNTYDWNHEIVLITGGASGIGAAVAQQFLSRNPRTRVIIADYSPLKWTPPKGTAVFYFEIDLTDREAIETLGKRVRQEVGHPTVLFNNAGIGKPTPLLHGPYEDFELTLRTNLLAQFHVTQQFLPDMVKNDHGHIVHSSSMSSIVPAPLISHYSASKAGLSALHDSLQMELKYFYKTPHVRQTLGVFGFIQTPMVTQDTGNTSFFVPLLHVDTVAEELVNAVYSTYGKTVILPGAAYYVTAMRGAPNWLFRIVRNFSARGLYSAAANDYSNRRVRLQAEWQARNLDASNR